MISMLMTTLTTLLNDPPTRFYGNSKYDNFWADIYQRFIYRVPINAEAPPERFYGNPRENTFQWVIEVLEWIFKGLYQIFIEVILPVLPELITLALVGCALWLMVTNEVSKAWSKMTMIFLVGCAILMMT